jgi:hypothetical protein
MDASQPAMYGQIEYLDVVCEQQPWQRKAGIGQNVMMARRLGDCAASGL